MNRTHHPPEFRARGRRSRTAAGLALAAVATAGTLGLLSACGGSPHASSPHASSMPTMNMPTMNMHASRPSTGRPVSGTAVAIKNFAFAPATLKVPVGTTVTWTNEDSEAHTVTSTGPGGPLHSAALGTHAAFSHTFTKPGTYAYLCTIHPFMTATVEVTR
ncbi:cupredoxin family copper-binding protein [Streptomyces sp900105755]|uniref:cupredoxin domain-containing protein n=1 Tax=Streptomyces sp. 900105755 TaxID=3154389 RepID=UPI00331D63FD